MPLGLPAVSEYEYVDLHRPHTIYRPLYKTHNTQTYHTYEPSSTDPRADACIKRTDRCIKDTDVVQTVIQTVVIYSTDVQTVQN